MAFPFSWQLQIVSDLHLETSVVEPSYATFNLHIQAENLFLLGDIGLVKDEGLFHFLERLLETNLGVKIFYVMGNHEYHYLTVDEANRKMREFEMNMNVKHGRRFILLDRRRYDLNSTVTVLGCTLWSRIVPEQAASLQERLKDFKETAGIRGRTVEKHNGDHEADLRWLNEQVLTISEDEPHRQIIVVTHHSPSVDERATAPRHRNSATTSGYATDLSLEACWTSPSVKMWAFGHTHHNVEYHDERGKLVVANQRGSRKPGDTSASFLPAAVVDTSTVPYTARRIVPKTLEMRSTFGSVCRHA
ncbi:uncharacterized protein PV09_07423 [Verruconis gallopava]|uniref:Calcineurin-like phosphoesterase domain-containing protein n=1 Tax=Verruconis gallopava TaxID=253628 RepID=A0A0D1YJU7_9PEZI|nr:uncharacterized protein PV09_07423 [Verruconis gallopava]KIW01137.1 hypothetical protein PV09_07423 [Verruconis gallopava]